MFEYPKIVQRVGDRDKENYSVKTDVSNTIPANAMSDRGQLVMESKYRIRKLTPKECYRLMGVTDEDADAMMAVNSNTQCYKQAGNSIVVDVLVHIFKQMGIGAEND